MKITTNTIGNYSPHIQNNSVKQAKFQPKANKVAAQQKVQQKPSELSTDEKSFFMKMYPGSKAEINDYHFYQKNGEMSGVKIGSLLDRRG